MIRVLATIIVPLLAPTILYFAYVVLADWRARRAARSRAGSEAGSGDSPDRSGRALRTAPWPWLAGIGVTLTAISLALFSEFERSAPGGVYVPPHTVDGEIVPAEVIAPPTGDAPDEPIDEPTDETGQ